MAEKALLKSISCVTLVTGIERIAALLQTLLVARALGITDYGTYSLIFGTIGLASSIAGMQMGLTGTVFVARYRDTNKERAAYVIRFVTRFGVAVGGLVLLCTIPVASHLAKWLLGPSGSYAAIIAGSVLVAISIVSGVQDGVIQGFEDFNSIAIARLFSIIPTLLFIYPAGVNFGLSGAMVTVLLGLVLKYIFLLHKIDGHKRSSGLPNAPTQSSWKELMWGFSFPSMVVSLLVGVVGWYGTVLLSKQIKGFDSVAIVSTGLQWRGPIFLLTTAVSAVAIPAISRLHQTSNQLAIRSLHLKVLALNGCFAVLASGGIIALSPVILKWYGSGFQDGDLVFCLVVGSAIPQVIAGVYMQNLVATGRMWQQALLHLWLIIPLGLGYLIAIPRFQSIGFAITNVVAWTLFSIALIVTSQAGSRGRCDRPPIGNATPRIPN